MLRQRLYGGVRLLGEGPCPKNVQRLDAGARPMVHTSWVKRFCDYVDKIPGGCWLWTGPLGGGGYGAFGAARSSCRSYREIGEVYVHRISWVAHFGPIPEGLWVLHKCDTPLCINPDHLFLGTNKDNSSDRKQKGRNPNRRGEANPACELGEATIRELRALWNTGEWSQRRLAARFNTEQSHVSRIVRGLSWGHL